MLDNVIYFSGIHGSGKSTLIKDITGNLGLRVYSGKYDLKLEDTYIRSIWRITKCYLEACDLIESCKENPKEIMMADRCIYDNFAYMQGFLKMGWVSGQDMKQFNRIFEATFDEEHRPRRIIYLDPPKDFVIQNIMRRWESHEKKWREDDFNYMENVMTQYQELYTEKIHKLDSTVNILRITDTDRKSRMDKSIDWIRYTLKEDGKCRI